jgi:hypothetical protein
MPFPGAPGYPPPLVSIVPFLAHQCRCACHGEQAKHSWQMNLTFVCHGKIMKSGTCIEIVHGAINEKTGFWNSPDCFNLHFLRF